MVNVYSVYRRGRAVIPRYEGGVGLEFLARLSLIPICYPFEKFKISYSQFIH